MECDDLSFLEPVYMGMLIVQALGFEPDHEVYVWGWANRGYNLGRTILSLKGRFGVSNSGFSSETEKY